MFSLLGSASCELSTEASSERRELCMYLYLAKGPANLLSLFRYI